MQDWRLIVLMLCLFAGSLFTLFGLLMLCRLERRQVWWRWLLSSFLYGLDVLPDEFKAVPEQWQRCRLARQLMASGLGILVIAGVMYWWMR